MGMIGVNFANVAVLNGGLIHIVYKTFKKGQKVWTTSYYFRCKDGALDAIISALNYTSIADDLINVTYGKYDREGHAVEFLILYDKDGRREE